MASAWKKPFQRLWRKVTNAGKVANSSNKKDSTPSNSRNRKGSNHSSTRESVTSTNTLHSLEDADDDVENHQQVSAKSSIAGDSVFGENGSLDSLADEEDQYVSASNLKNGSLDSLVDEKDHRKSVSSDENAFEYFPSRRKDSLILDQLLLDINTERKEDGTKTPENNKTKADDNAKAIVSAISVKRNSARSKLYSDSDSAMAVFESSNLDDASLLDINTKTKENDVKATENNHTESDNKHKYVDVKAMVAAISGRPDSAARSKLDSDSLSLMSMAASEGSDLDDASLLDINSGMEETGVKTPENTQTAAEDEHEDVDVKAIVAAISGRPNRANSETDSQDSDSSMAVSECSDLEDDSSDEESDHEVFDIEDHINKLVKRDKDRNVSVISGKVPKKAEQIVDSDIESAQTSGKGSETEESPISDDFDSEASDQDEDPSALSSRKSLKMKRDLAKAEVPLKENGRTHHLVPMLEESRAQDLRWPFSNFYVKELKPDQGMSLSDHEEVFPSYKSTVAFATHPRESKRNVIQGRVWCVEWWAKEDLLK